MAGREKPLVWLHGEIQTPPFSRAARLEAGFLLRRLQQGELLDMPHARPMPSVGTRCLELRVRDEGHNWRIFCRKDPDAVLILEVHDKRAAQTPKQVLETCRDRAARYDREAKGSRR